METHKNRMSNFQLTHSLNTADERVSYRNSNNNNPSTLAVQPAKHSESLYNTVLF